MTGFAHHPWLGGLLGDAAMAEILSPERDLVRMLRVEAAWTRTIAPAPDAERIAALIEAASISPSDLAAGSAQDGVPVPALVAKLKAALPEEDGRWLHAGLTSQDVIDTALMLTIGECAPLLVERMKETIAALDRVAARDGARHVMAMTRMQPALPITVADRISTWRRPLTHLLDHLEASAESAAILQWGGPVGVRDDTLPPDTGQRFAAHLGLRDPGNAWHSERGVLADLAGPLSRITAALGKMGKDVALMAQTSADTLALSGGGSSSAMPHKQNPILAEVLVTLARHNAGDVALMHHALIHEQERSGSAWMLEWLVLPRMLETTATSLRAATRLLSSIERIGPTERSGEK